MPRPAGPKRNRRKFSRRGCRGKRLPNQKKSTTSLAAKFTRLRRAAKWDSLGQRPQLKTDDIRCFGDNSVFLRDHDLFPDESGDLIYLRRNRCPEWVPGTE